MGIFDNLKDNLTEVNWTTKNKLQDLKWEVEYKAESIKNDFEDLTFNTKMKVNDFIIDKKVDLEISREINFEKLKKQTLNRGCVIRVERFNQYHHYGIYAGNKEVIHYHDGKISVDTLYDFCYSRGIAGHNEVEVLRFNDAYAKKFTLEESYERALGLMEKKEFNIVNNNCEHFTLWCRIGEATSTQAFGSKSKEYDNDFSVTNLSFTPILISKIFSQKYGMKVSRVINIFSVQDEKSREDILSTFQTFQITSPFLARFPKLFLHY